VRLLDLLKTCRCRNTGFAGTLICVNHLQKAFEWARSNGNTELMAVILKKQKDLSKV